MRNASSGSLLERYQLAVIEMDSLHVKINDLELDLDDREREIAWLEELIFKMQKVIRERSKSHGNISILTLTLILNKCSSDMSTKAPQQSGDECVLAVASAPSTAALVEDTFTDATTVPPSSPHDSDMHAIANYATPKRIRRSTATFFPAAQVTVRPSPSPSKAAKEVPSEDVRVGHIDHGAVLVEEEISGEKKLVETQTVTSTGQLDNLFYRLCQDEAVHLYIQPYDLSLLSTATETSSALSGHSRQQRRISSRNRRVRVSVETQTDDSLPPLSTVRRYSIFRRKIGTTDRVLTRSFLNSNGGNGGKGSFSVDASVHGEIDDVQVLTKDPSGNLIYRCVFCTHPVDPPPGHAGLTVEEAMAVAAAAVEAKLEMQVEQENMLEEEKISMTIERPHVSIMSPNDHLAEPTVAAKAPIINRKKFVAPIEKVMPSLLSAFFPSRSSLYFKYSVVF